MQEPGMQERLRLQVIVGSTREGRFGPTVASWFVERAREHGAFDVQLLDLADVPLPLHLPRRPPVELADTLRRLDEADAFVVVTPEYNHSFPAVLKQAIDLATPQWRRKPVGFVSYGGLSGGLRAVEQLRVVFAEVHAATIRDTVSFHGASQTFDEHGRPRDDVLPAAAAVVLLDELAWWSAALRTARDAWPAGSGRPAA